MDVDQDVTPIISKKKVEKPDSSTDTSLKVESKKLDKKSDTDESKPRIVLTFRSEKSGAKSSNMKIVPTEEKHEEVSPRRSSRTRAAKWDSDDDNEAISPKKAPSVSENDECSDSSFTGKRSSSRRNKECENVVANAIARKEKSFNEPVQTRLSRRIKPTAKVLANEELRIGLESQNNARLGIQQEKVPEEGVRKRPLRACRVPVGYFTELPFAKIKSDEDVEVVEVESQNQVMKLKHLCELGLKAINPDRPDGETSKEKDHDAESLEAIEIDDDMEEEEEIDDDTEVISKLLEADADSESDSDEDFYCSAEESSQTGQRSRRSARLTSSFGNDSEHSSPVQDDGDSAPLRRSGRKKRRVNYVFMPQANTNVADTFDTKRDGEQEEVSSPASAEEGSEAACPPDEASIIAACYCDASSNVYAAPSDLTEPVFCQAIEMVDGVRVGCSHGARKAAGGYAALVRAGPRAPFILACTLHYAQLGKHMCCPACGLFCTQGTFYQCSKGHLFHLECGLPYNDNKGKPGCPHCGLLTYRWQPANRECCKVRVEMRCSNKRIFLPEQREQCTPAYLSFSTLKPSQLDQGPVIPEDLLPAPPIDLKRLCEKPANTDYEDLLDGSPAEKLCDAILAGETVDQLIPKIMAVSNVNTPLSAMNGGTCAHCAASRGHLAAMYLLQYAGANLDAVDAASHTPLMRAVLALADKSEDKSPTKSEKTDEKESIDGTEPNQAKEGEMETDVKEKEAGVEDKKEHVKMEKPSDDDIMKVIRYLVAAGCDVNLPGPDGMSALHMAAQHGEEGACAVLLRAGGAHTEARDHGGWTPLVWAAENCHEHVVRLLLSEGADAEATDSEGNAAVHWCALGGAAQALRMLLDAAPQAVHALNAHTDTPLHVAARQGHYACVVILLARGARTDVENSAGELPVEVCTGRCQTAISLNMQMSLAVGNPPARRRILSSDISRGRELHPIPCINEVDDEPLPHDFTYVTSHVMPNAISIETTTQSLQGCTCTDGDCGASSCSCCVLGVRRWAARGRLLPNFPYHDPPMLFECNVTCACHAKKCTNSMVSRLCARGSVFVRAAVFRAGGARGWGLRGAGAVPRGAPVAAYCGELLALPEADSRAQDHYMFALDIKPDLLEQCTDKTQLCVDAAQYGGAARFINHSCRPNLAPVRVFTTTRDLRLPTVALFATRDISAGEEFTFDYGDKFWSVKSKWMRCECGEPDCRYPVKTNDDAESNAP